MVFLSRSISVLGKVQKKTIFLVSGRIVPQIMFFFFLFLWSIPREIEGLSLPQTIF